MKIDSFMSELDVFYSPLVEATQDKESLKIFFQIFGFELDDTTLTALFDDIQEIIITFTPSFNNLLNSNNPQTKDIISLTSKIYQAIERITESSFLHEIVSSDDNLILELFDFLSYRYLSVRIYLIESALSSLGVVSHELKETADLGGRQVDFVRTKLQWSRLADFFQDNSKWAYDIYGWAGNNNNGETKHFDFVKAIRNSISLIQSSGLSLGYLREISDPNEVGIFLKNAGDEPVFEAFLPFFQDELDSFDNDANRPIFSAEAGLKLLPFGDLTKPESLGLALAPYVKGDVPNKQQLSENLSFDINVSGQATGGAYLTITPEGIDVVKGEGISAEFDFSMIYENPDQSPIFLLGDSNSSHIQTGAILSAVGGNMNGDFFLKAGFENLRISIDLSKNGLLNEVLSTPIEIDFGNVILAWKTGRGVHFEGGNNLGFTVPVNLNIGPIYINSVGVNVESTDNNLGLSLGVNGRVEIGPITAIINDFGLKPLLEFEKQGNLGNSNFSVGFKSPTSIGLSINTSGVTGGGFLLIDPPHYAGILHLDVKDTFSIMAIGVLTTELPDGDPGFSMLFQITAEFSPIQLGLGFALTGVGGMVGINRKFHEENMRKAVKNHEFDLFPTEVPDFFTIIDTYQSVLPPKKDHHVFGPIVKIHWGGTVKLVEFEVGIFLQLGGPVQVYIIGSAWSVLPDEDTKILVLEFDVFGVVDFGDGRLEIEATLSPKSKFMGFNLDGQMALKADWHGADKTFVMSVGGFHPRFKQIPAGFPNLKRLQILAKKSGANITLQLYFAITTNSLQIGAKLDLLAKKSGFKIVGYGGFDALIIFNPFSFNVLIFFGVRVSKGWFSVGLDLELELSGPNPLRAKGYVKFSYGWGSKKIRFSKKFSDEKPQQLPYVSPVDALFAELSNAEHLRFELPTWARAGVTYREGAETMADPLADIIISQEAVPLNVTIDKFAGIKLRESDRRLDIKANVAADIVDVVKTLFAPAQFIAMSDDQKLSSPAFTNYKSGLRLKSQYVTPQTCETRELVFETVLRESRQYSPAETNDPTFVYKAHFICLWAPDFEEEGPRVANWSLAGAGLIHTHVNDNGFEANGETGAVGFDDSEIAIFDNIATPVTEPNALSKTFSFEEEVNVAF